MLRTLVVFNDSYVIAVLVVLGVWRPTLLLSWSSTCLNVQAGVVEVEDAVMVEVVVNVVAVIAGREVVVVFSVEVVVLTRGKSSMDRRRRQCLNT